MSRWRRDATPRLPRSKPHVFAALTGADELIRRALCLTWRVAKVTGESRSEMKEREWRRKMRRHKTSKTLRGSHEKRIEVVNKMSW